MYEKQEKQKLDLRAFGQSVKEARESKNLSREQLAEILDLSPRHTQYIETRGQHPSLQKFYEIVALFNISVDNLFFLIPRKARPPIAASLMLCLMTWTKKNWRSSPLRQKL